ncbi:hypothetical protein AVEN_223778-1 [Araneus ventricosus]|uniref:Uncharacterized protein n=1 Tax=Araneus ventricosus TaxID=182803 RepID=A0A4Y2DN42_ARAVE|nr:hypothetical protein AVEN_223778-1 [Araneus ventricosus]
MAIQSKWFSSEVGFSNVRPHHFHRNFALTASFGAVWSDCECPAFSGTFTTRPLHFFWNTGWQTSSSMQESDEKWSSPREKLELHPVWIFFDPLGHKTEMRQWVTET